MQSIHDDVKKLGYHPFPVPLGLKRNSADTLESKCIRCDTCDGYPCLVHAKSDSDINCIRQIMHLPNVTLLTEAKVTKIVTNATGTAVTSVEVQHNGPANVPPELATYFGDIIAVCCGAINSVCPPPPIRHRQAPPRPRQQQLRSGRPQLHVPPGRRHPLPQRQS